VVVRFVEIGGIVDHRCLNSFFHNHIKNAQYALRDAHTAA
jgi:hypothetical protein